jgi:hypothetical protein
LLIVRRETPQSAVGSRQQAGGRRQ